MDAYNEALRTDAREALLPAARGRRLRQLPVVTRPPHTHAGGTDSSRSAEQRCTPAARYASMRSAPQRPCTQTIPDMESIETGSSSHIRCSARSLPAHPNGVPSHTLHADTASPVHPCSAHRSSCLRRVARMSQSFSICLNLSHLSHAFRDSTVICVPNQTQPSPYHSIRPTPLKCSTPQIDCATSISLVRHYLIESSSQHQNEGALQSPCLVACQSPCLMLFIVPATSHFSSHAPPST